MKGYGYIVLSLGISMAAMGCTQEASNSDCSAADTGQDTGSESDVTESESLVLPASFDSIGPTVHAFESASGRVIRYIDEGDASWAPFVFVGGNGTSVRVFALTEFARSLRESLEIRVISVQRNGFGDTAFDSGLGYADYAAEVEELLAHLNVDTFGVVAISGGGPYANEVIARNAASVTTVHLAATFSHQFDGTSGSMDLVCAIPADLRPDLAQSYSQSPKTWFTFDEGSATHRVPGLQAQAHDDAARTFFMGDQVGAPDALVHEFGLYCGEQLTEVPLDELNAPVFLYAGTGDTAVAIGHSEQWQAHFGDKVSRTRVYEDEGHDIQYRHWDQILLDMAGHGAKTLVCHNGENQMLGDSEADAALADGAFYGLCAWGA